MSAIRINGLERLIDQLKSISKEAERMTNDNLNLSAIKIADQANFDAPKFLKGNVVKRDRFNNGKTWRVYIDDSALPIAAYWEFGTGLSAATILAPYPRTIQQIALTFKTTGEGTLRGKPFFYPAYFEEIPELIKNLKRDLERLKL